MVGSVGRLLVPMNRMLTCVNKDLLCSLALPQKRLTTHNCFRFDYIIGNLSAG